MQALGGLISIHGHGKAANYETISSRLKFKQEQKTDLLREYVDVIEVGGVDGAKTYREKLFPRIGFQRPLIVGSDDHAKGAYPTDKYCWMKADPTFAGLLMALREPETRFCLTEVPPSVDRLRRNRTRYIKCLSFWKKATMPGTEEWLQGEVPLNPGLVAVIGNKEAAKALSQIASGCWVPAGRLVPSPSSTNPASVIRRPDVLSTSKPRCTGTMARLGPGL